MNNSMLQRFFFGMVVLASLAASGVSIAQVLPEDRADLLLHSYDGDEIQITGPSLLLRKKVTSNISVYGNYYVDSISSASIDVRSYASPYKEERKEFSVGGDFILGDAIISTGVTSSDENDFEARSGYIGISQDVFGGLTTISLGFARGSDDIYRMVKQPDGSSIRDPTFAKEAKRRSYRLGLTQVLTKNFIMSFDFEGITDEGYLNNPYRQVRFVDPLQADGFDWEPEVYPETRTSSAFSVGGRYYLRPGSAVYASGRIFNDTWGISAWNAALGYTFSLRSRWLLDLSYRYYTQEGADFYSDLFAYPDQQNFMARDKELSTFQDHGIHIGVTYNFPVEFWDFVERGSANLNYDYMFFKYDDFRNATVAGPVGQEPLFDFSADIFQLYVSFWF